MANEKIDQRVIQILRWSILIQVLFLIISTLRLRFFLPEARPTVESDWPSLISIFLMASLLGILYVKRINSRISKTAFLAILYLLALITIFARQIFSFSVSRQVFINPNPLFFPIRDLTFFRWDAIFFLIIPLVFIAWQYSMREVIVYSLVITVAESLLSFLQSEDSNIFFVIVNMLSSFGRVGIFIIVGWIENRLVTLQRAQQDELLAVNQKLRKYALSSEKLAHTQERNRLARELHDTLAHTLSSTAVQLEATKALFDRNPNEARKMLAQTLENTKNGLVETRRALADLRTSDLESFGLTRAIRNMATSAAERGGFTVDFHMDKDLDMLPDDITHCLYRTALESVENALRHANPKKIVISLISEDEKILLNVSDDGVGFNQTDVKKEHFGIRGMRERVEMLGGKMKIVSSPGSGTRVEVELMREND